MLQKMRSGVKSPVIKILTFGLLLLAMGGLALTDVQGMFRQGVQKDVVAQIGNEKIHTQDLDRLVQQILHQGNIAPQDAYRAGLPLQILEKEINNRIFSLAASDLGISVSDEIAANQIREMLRPAATQGLMEKDALQIFLQRSGLTEAKLVDAVKRDIATQSLLAPLASSMHIPQEMIDVVVRFQSEQRKGRYITIGAQDIEKLPTPSDADILAHYTATKNRYMQQERRDVGILLIDGPALHMKDVAVTEQDARAYYDSHLDSFGAPEKRTIDQVVFDTEQQAKDFVAKASVDQAGFAAAAAQVNKNVVTDTYAQKDLEEALAPVFTAKSGTVTAPIKTGLGWYVVRVDNITPSTVKGFDQVKASLIEKLKKDKKLESLYSEANRIDDMLAGGKGMDTVASELGLKAIIFKNVDATGDIKDGGFLKIDGLSDDKINQILKAAFALNLNESSQMIEVTADRFAVVEVRHITAATPRDLANVKSDVVKSLMAQRTATAVQAKANSLAEAAKKSSFESAAKSANKNIQSWDWVGRPQNNTPAPVSSVLFNARKKGDIVVSGDAATAVVAVVDDMRLDQAAKAKARAPEEMARIKAMLDMSLQNDMLEQYRNYLMSKYKVRVYDDVVTKMYKVDDTSL